jgi:hypothetical protein
MRVLRKGYRNTKRLGYTSLIHPVLEYVSACCDPCGGGQINALDRVQKKAAQFTNYTKGSDYDNLARLRTITNLCALFIAYTGERSWKAICDRLRRSYYFNTVHHVRKIRGRKQRTDIVKYSFANRITKNRKQLPAETSGLSVVNRRYLESDLGKQL